MRSTRADFLNSKTPEPWYRAKRDRPGGFSGGWLPQHAGRYPEPARRNRRAFLISGASPEETEARVSQTRVLSPNRCPAPPRRTFCKANKCFVVALSVPLNNSRTLPVLFCLCINKSRTRFFCFSPVSSLSQETAEDCGLPEKHSNH